MRSALDPSDHVSRLRCTDIGRTAIGGKGGPLLGCSFCDSRWNCGLVLRHVVTQKHFEAESRGRPGECILVPLFSGCALDIFRDQRDCFRERPNVASALIKPTLSVLLERPMESGLSFLR